MTPEDFERAKTAQKRLVKKIETLDAVKGIGIGLTPAHDAYALEVLVDAKRPTTDIPEIIDGIPVILLPVGKIVAI